MLQIYGITYDHTTNYGSCLQAYALQTAIERIRTQGEEWNYQLIPIRTFDLFRNPPDHLRIILINFIMGLVESRFRRFEQSCMKYADVSGLGDLPGLNETADAFVCGSDVIWNPDFNQRCDAFWLEFARKYKFSYAASFGKAQMTEEDTKRIGEHLKTFDAISVREFSAAVRIRTLTGRNAVPVVDPVLLLNQDDWNKVAGSRKPGGRKGYIFLYVTHRSGNVEKILRGLKRETGLKVIPAAWVSKPSEIAQQKTLRILTPRRWLQLLRDAEYVITNSFHATAFSVLFHKKFYTVVEGEKEGGINIRMYEFLSALGLADRMISSGSEQWNMETPDFSHADSILEDMRRDSYRFLYTNLENAYQQKIKEQENHGS